MAGISSRARVRSPVSPAHVLPRQPGEAAAAQSGIMRGMPGGPPGQHQEMWRDWPVCSEAGKR
eukprot:6858948-Prorocentrum_lima.AAC.1